MSEAKAQANPERNSPAGGEPKPRESWSTRWTRWRFNVHPAYRGTGARITFIASDWSEIRLRIPLSWRTRNIVGSIFGGSLYAALDPIYMIQMMRGLGPDFIVWDKAATIRFKRPGRETLFATFRMPAKEVEAVRTETLSQGKLERTYTVELVNASGETHVVCEKVLSIRWKGAPNSGG
ncbi:MAG: acyl-coenzyme A thioesterase PaaI-like protein [Planctomycetota bacterium]|jgi:acyl-coenzyme A thioesterase PaaI-like protein